MTENEKPNSQGPIVVAIIVAGALIGGGIYLASANEEPPPPAYAPLIPGIVPTTAAPTFEPPEPTNEFSCERSGGAWVPKDTYPYGVCVGWSGEMNHFVERARTVSMTRASSASGSGSIVSANHATEALPSGTSTPSVAASAAP